MEKREENFKKLIRVIKSCKNSDHLKTAVKASNYFMKMYEIGETDKQYQTAKTLVGLMKIKCKVGHSEKHIIEDESFGPSTNDWSNAANNAGLKDIFFEDEGEELTPEEMEKIRAGEIISQLSNKSKVAVSIPAGKTVKGYATPGGTGTNTDLKSAKGVVEGEEIVGGVADNKTPKDLAKKHKRTLRDIANEIKVGKGIEREHTNSDDTAEEITMDHIDEFPDYYTNKKHGVKASEKGLEKFNKKRIKKKDIKFEEEIEESSTAGSSGAFVGALGGKRKPIKRSFYKGKVPVSSAGGMTTPIGKMFSFNKKNESMVFKKNQLKESNVVTKKEMLESSDSGTFTPYDSPGGWGNSKFFGTEGKKGNAVQRKGNDHKVTYKGDGKNLSTFVKIKEKCKTFPYCIQDANAIETSKQPFSVNEEDEQLIENICKKTGKSKKYVHSLINRYL